MGATFTPGRWISPVLDKKNQGATIGIDPRNGRVYVVWRRFATANQTDAILVRRSNNGGKTFQRPVVIAEINSFDQVTIDETQNAYGFRTNAYPTVAIDGGGRIYVAWQERGFGQPLGSDSRIVMSTSQNGRRWTEPFAVDDVPRPGHQMMPSLAFASGKLHLSYYDFRDDASGVFDPVVVDPAGEPSGQPLRHTFDLRVAQALPAERPIFTINSAMDPVPSARTSKYLGFFNDALRGFEQTEFNAPKPSLVSARDRTLRGRLHRRHARPVIRPELRRDMGTHTPRLERHRRSTSSGPTIVTSGPRQTATGRATRLQTPSPRE